MQQWARNKLNETPGGVAKLQPSSVREPIRPKGRHARHDAAGVADQVVSSLRYPAVEVSRFRNFDSIVFAADELH